MSVSKPVNLELDVEKSSTDGEVVAAEMENVLAVLASEWGLGDELADSEIELQVGVSPESSRDVIGLSDPVSYNRMVRDLFPESSLRDRALGFEGPYHEMFEEAGHYLSGLTADRTAKGFEDFIANELIGGLAIDTFDPEVIDWELRQVRQNLEDLNQLNSDQDISYVRENMDEFERTVKNYVSSLDAVEDEYDLKLLLEDVKGTKDSFLDNSPEHEVDYPRSGEDSPKSYSDWFVEDIVFNFMDPMEDYFRGEMEFDEVIPVSRQVAELTLERLEDQKEDASELRDKVHERQSRRDRAYFAGRSMVSEARQQYTDEEIVWMGNEEIYDEFSDSILATDAEVRNEYDITSPKDL